MTDKPRAAEPGTAGSAPGGSAQADRSDGPASERVVIRDKRKVDRAGGKGGPAAKADTTTTTTDESTDEGGLTPGTETESELAEDSAELAEVAEAEVGAAAGGEQPVVDAPAEPFDHEAPAGRPGPFGAELEALRAELDERTRDLQRVSAEYANYRKRVDRDRGLVAEQTTGTVLAALLPVLDDLDRARDHGDLVGPFGTVAEQLTGVVTKFGLTAFGEKGDPFDPTRHEAVAHQTSADVSVSTCVDVMRRGYLLGERLLRPALVAVADPE